jgi:hypothetical protein
MRGYISYTDKINMICGYLHIPLAPQGLYRLRGFLLFNVVLIDKTVVVRRFSALFVEDEICDRYAC